MDMFFMPFLGTPIWLWLFFLVIVLFLLVLDLGLFNRGDHEIEIGKSLKLSAFYISLGIAFSGIVYWQMGATETAQYLTAFVVEKTLSLDNIFVIALIFSMLAIPRQYQHRVLFWGVLGVIILRGLMIGFGSAIVANYHFVLYLFAAFLIFTGIKMLFAKDEAEPDMSRNPVLRFARKYLRVTDDLHGNKFFVKQPQNGKLLRFATPLFLALIMVEFTDIIFAVDSVPAVFTITTDPFIVYTSNIFAILGLRALFFALAAVLHRFAYLKYALSVLLIFIGSKMFIADLMNWDKFPAIWSLIITFGILTIGVVVSLLKTKNNNHHSTHD
ncbi:TerC family protein [Bartonella sp. HY038]|uniref:TerC family protein n=1 Tax=Bartonella sp. HY038 TaxID=2759660 RepID=UPI0015FB5579|nr:TerC family protein [Bartonella sp. HY038]